MSEKVVFIPTGMYSADAEKILRVLLVEMGKSYNVQSTFRRNGVGAFEIERAADNEIVFALRSSNTGNFGRVYRYWEKLLGYDFYDMPSVPPASLKAAAERIGWQIKLLAREYSNCEFAYQHETPMKQQEQQPGSKDYFKNTFWKRQNNTDVKQFMAASTVNSDNENENLPITVADLYFIYEKLLGRLTIEKRNCRYDREVVNRLVGEKRDIISTEAELARREELKRIEAEYDLKIFDANPCYGHRNDRTSKAYDELNALIDDFKAKCKKNVEALKAERDAKIAEVNATMAFLTA